MRILIRIVIIYAARCKFDAFVICSANKPNVVRIETERATHHSVETENVAGKFDDAGKFPTTENPRELFTPRVNMRRPH